jgi:PPOX class probable F420-dependent enzyme
VIESSHTGVLTTLGRDGGAIALPIWFVVLDRKIYVSGPARSKRFSRVRRDPRVSFLVEHGERWAELVAVHLTGTARVVGDEPDLAARVASASATKYAGFRTDRSEMPAATRERVAVEGAILEITPDDRILSWDNSRLFEPEG